MVTIIYAPIFTIFLRIPKEDISNQITRPYFIQADTAVCNNFRGPLIPTGGL